MVSVIIPTYNRADTIKRSIDSVLSQSEQNFEIIVVDDGSTDNTEQIVMGYADPRIRYLKNDRRMGANGARNVGIQHAVGEYIAFQDSDDVWRSGKLEKQLDMLQNRKELDVVYSRYVRHWPDGGSEPVPDKNYTKEQLQDGIAHMLARCNVIGTPTMIARKKCFEECGMFDPKIRRFQDWEINIGFVQRYQYGFIEEPLLDAYISADSITSTVKSGLDSVALIVKKHQTFFETQGTMDMHLSSLANTALAERSLKELQSLLGRRLFLRSMYANAENNARRQESIKKNYAFIKAWMTQEKRGALVNSCLSGYADSSVALYGLGDIGRLFLNALTDEDQKKIRFVIDRNRLLSSEYRILHPDTLGRADFEGIACVVITAIAHEEEVREKLTKLTECPVVSVYNMVLGKEN